MGMPGAGILVLGFPLAGRAGNCGKLRERRPQRESECKSAAKRTRALHKKRAVHSLSENPLAGTPRRASPLEFTGFLGAPLWQRKAGPAVHGPCFSPRESSIETSEIRFLRLTGPVRLKKPFLRPPRGPSKPRNEYASYRHTRFGVLGPPLPLPKVHSASQEVLKSPNGPS